MQNICRHRKGGNGPVPRKRARILSSQEDYDALMRAAASTRHKMRNRLAVALNFHAGLRMPEIARLNRFDVIDERNSIRDFLVLREGVSKRTPGRRIALSSNAILRQAVCDYLRSRPGAPDEPLILSERGTRMRGDAIAYVFYKLYRQAGLPGYTPFSGRRTHIARAIEEGGGAGATIAEMYDAAGLRAMGAMEAYNDIPTNPAPIRKHIKNRNDARQMSFF